MPTTVVNTFPERVQLEIVRPDEAVLVGVTIANGFSCQQGDVLGQITASGKFRRRSRSTANSTGFSNASPTGHVVDASRFVAGDVLTTSTGTAIGTVAANGIDAVNNIITLTANAANNVASGVDVIATDGSAVSQGIADLGSDGSGDTTISAFVAGVLNAALLLGLDSTAKSELSGATLAGGVFKF